MLRNFQNVYSWERKESICIPKHLSSPCHILPNLSSSLESWYKVSWHPPLHFIFLLAIPVPSGQVCQDVLLGWSLALMDQSCFYVLNLGNTFLGICLNEEWGRQVIWPKHWNSQSSNKQKNKNREHPQGHSLGSFTNGTFVVWDFALRTSFLFSQCSPETSRNQSPLL